MNGSPTPLTQTLVFIGGGHSHAIALKKWAMNPIAGVRVILITDVVHTPYSGMLPGYVAGLYTYDQCHIDLRPLCQFANAEFVRDRAIGLDLDTHRVICQNHPPIAFDWLSIDIGSTPAANRIPGADAYAIPAKPISKFLTKWDAVVNQVHQQSIHRLRMGVVGGGAGGVELAMSIHGRLQPLCDDPTQSLNALEIHLFQRGSDLLPERHPRMRRTVQHTMLRQGIHLHLGESVSAIDVDDDAPSADDETYRVRCESGLTVPCDRVFWVTQASAASWLQSSGLDTDGRGFVRVNDCLQSTSHAQVFAAGDIATMIHHPRPKAGVFAVRQGNPLFENLQRAVLKQPLKPFQPQKQFLILVGTGDKRAIASRGFLTFGPHRRLWQWKDYIDRAFMDRFTHLDADMERMASSKNSRPSPPRIAPSPSAPSTETPDVSLPTMYCAGCASKVGSSVLDRVLQRLQAEFPHSFQRSDIVLGLTDPDDAAAIALPHDTTLIQTLDYFRALVDDPFIFGQIAANHCLSDLFAMGATPHSVLAIASLPHATDRIHEDILYPLLSGSLKVLHAAGAILIGGHTVEGSELALGFSCNGILHDGDKNGMMMRKGGMQPGDRLILTKPLGTGTLFAAAMQFKAKGRWIEGAIASMLQSNQQASHILQQHQATACTDITGFGLLGHLLEMRRSSTPSDSNHPKSYLSNIAPFGVELDIHTLPILTGANETIHQRLFSSLHPQNSKAFTQVKNATALENHPLAPLLVDPQTAGGLLASVPAENAHACLSALQHQGYPHSRIIGTVTESTEGGSIQVRE